MAKWDTKFINDLPDSSFAYIEKGGSKDSDGKTTPRSLRHLPYKDADGKVDLPHVRNALARLDQVKEIPDSEKAAIKTKLQNALKSADKSGSDKPFTFRASTCIRLKADENGNLPSEFQIFPAGSYNTVPYGTLNFDKATLQQMCDNAKSGMVRNDIPIDVDHEGSGHGGAAAGWLKNDGLEARDDGLWSVGHTWNNLGKQLVGDDQYRYISPEWAFDYQDPQNSTHHGAVLVAASLVNKPLFRNMNQAGLKTASEKGLMFATDEKGKQINPLTSNPSVMLLFSEESKQINTMPVIADILKKPVADRTEEEVKALAESTELTEEQKAQLQKETADAEAAQKEVAEKAAKEKEEAEAKEKADKEAAEKAEAEKTAAEKGGKTLTASEYATFQANNEKLRKMEAAEKFAAFKATEKGGQLLPKNMQPAIDFYLAAEKVSKELAEKFEAFVKALPTQKLVAGEKGDTEENTSLTASESIVKLIEDKKKADPKLTEFKAQEIVRKENPELWKEYKEELKTK